MQVVQSPTGNSRYFCYCKRLNSERILLQITLNSELSSNALNKPIIAPSCQEAGLAGAQQGRSLITFRSTCLLLEARIRSNYIPCRVYFITTSSNNQFKLYPMLPPSCSSLPAPEEILHILVESSTWIRPVSFLSAVSSCYLCSMVWRMRVAGLHQYIGLQFAQLFCRGLPR